MTIESAYLDALILVALVLFATDIVSMDIVGVILLLGFRATFVFLPGYIQPVKGVRSTRHGGPWRPAPPMKKGRRGSPRDGL